MRKSKSPDFFHPGSRPPVLLRCVAWVQLPLFLFWIFVPSFALIPQPVQVPQINAPRFQSDEFNPVFDEARQASDTTGWTSIVQSGKTVLTAAWEASVDLQITALVSAASNGMADDVFLQVDEGGVVAGSDQVLNSKADYERYLRDALEEQKRKARADWELARDLAVQNEQERFLAKLSEKSLGEQASETGAFKTDVRSGEQSYFQDLAAKENADTVNGSAGQKLFEAAQARLEQQSNEWKDDWRDRLDLGLDQFNSASAELAQDRQSFLDQNRQADGLWQENLQEARDNETRIRLGLGNFLSGLEQMIATNPLFYGDAGCAAERKSNCDSSPGAAAGPLNAAGQLVLDKLNALKAVLAENRPLSELVLETENALLELRTHAGERSATWTALSDGSSTMVETIAGSQAYRFNPSLEAAYKNMGLNIENFYRQGNRSTPSGYFYNPGPGEAALNKLQYVSGVRAGGKLHQVAIDLATREYWLLETDIGQTRTCGRGGCGPVEYKMVTSLPRRLARLGSVFEEICAQPGDANCIDTAKLAPYGLGFDTGLHEKTRKLEFIVRGRETGNWGAPPNLIPAGYDARETRARDGDFYGNAAAWDGRSGQMHYAGWFSQGGWGAMNVNYTVWEEDCILWIFCDEDWVNHSTGSSAYTAHLNYNWHDSIAAANKITWDGYGASITAMLGHWRDGVRPAVEAWETQVSEYENNYATWQENRVQLENNYQTTFLQGQQELNQARNRFVEAMGQEKRQAGIQQAEAKKNLAEALADFEQVVARENATKENLVSAGARLDQILGNNAPGRTDAVEFIRGGNTNQSPLAAARGPQSNKPDARNLDQLTAGFASFTTGLGNFGTTRALEIKADEVRRQASERLADLVRSVQGASIDGIGQISTGYSVTVGADGSIAATRQIVDGRAIKRAGEDGEEASDYDTALREQNFEFRASRRQFELSNQQDLFKAWDLLALQRAYAAEIASLNESTRSQAAFLSASLGAQDESIRSAIGLFNGSRSYQVEQANKPSGWGQFFSALAAIGAAIGSVFTGGATLAAYAGVMATINGVKSAIEGGGFLGALLGAVSGAVNAYAGQVGLNLDLHYDPKDGFGASAGVGFGPLKIGASYTPGEGLSGSAGVKLGGLNLGAEINENGLTGQAGLGLDLGNNLDLGLGYDSENGFGASLGYENDGFSGRLGLSAAGGLALSAGYEGQSASFSESEGWNFASETLAEVLGPWQDRFTSISNAIDKIGGAFAAAPPIDALPAFDLWPPDASGVFNEEIESTALPNGLRVGDIAALGLNTIADLETIGVGTDTLAELNPEQLTEILSQLDLRDFDLSRLNLSELDLSRINLAGADFSGLALRELDLSKIDLERVDLSNADFSGVHLADIDPDRINFANIDLAGADFSDVKLADLDLAHLDLSGVDLTGANLAGVDMVALVESGADLSNLDLSDVDLSEVSEELLARAGVYPDAYGEFATEDDSVDDADEGEPDFFERLFGADSPDDASLSESESPLAFLEDDEEIDDAYLEDFEDFDAPEETEAEAGSSRSDLENLPVLQSRGVSAGGEAAVDQGQPAFFDRDQTKALKSANGTFEWEGEKWTRTVRGKSVYFVNEDKSRRVTLNDRGFLEVQSLKQKAKPEMYDRMGRRLPDSVRTMKSGEYQIFKEKWTGTMPAAEEIREEIKARNFDHRYRHELFPDQKEVAVLRGRSIVQVGASSYQSSGQGANPIFNGPDGTTMRVLDNGAFEIKQNGKLLGYQNSAGEWVAATGKKGELIRRDQLLEQEFQTRNELSRKPGLVSPLLLRTFNQQPVLNAATMAKMLAANGPGSGYGALPGLLQGDYQRKTKGGRTFFEKVTDGVVEEVEFLDKGFVKFSRKEKGKPVQSYQTDLAGNRLDRDIAGKSYKEIQAFYPKWIQFKDNYLTPDQIAAQSAQEKLAIKIQRPTGPGALPYFDEITFEKTAKKGVFKAGPKEIKLNQNGTYEYRENGALVGFLDTTGAFVPAGKSRTNQIEQRYKFEQDSRDPINEGFQTPAMVAWTEAQPSIERDGKVFVRETKGKQVKFVHEEMVLGKIVRKEIKFQNSGDAAVVIQEAVPGGKFETVETHFETARATRIESAGGVEKNIVLTGKILTDFKGEKNREKRAGYFEKYRQWDEERDLLLSDGEIKQINAKKELDLAAGQLPSYFPAGTYERKGKKKETEFQLEGDDGKIYAIKYLPNGVREFWVKEDGQRKTYGAMDGGGNWLPPQKTYKDISRDALMEELYRMRTEVASGQAIYESMTFQDELYRKYLDRQPAFAFDPAKFVPGLDLFPIEGRPLERQIEPGTPPTIYYSGAVRDAQGREQSVRYQRNSDGTLTVSLGEGQGRITTTLDAKGHPISAVDRGPQFKNISERWRKEQDEGKYYNPLVVWEMRQQAQYDLETGGTKYSLTGQGNGVFDGVQNGNGYRAKLMENGTVEISRFENGQMVERYPIDARGNRVGLAGKTTDEITDQILKTPRDELLYAEYRERQERKIFAREDLVLLRDFPGNTAGFSAEDRARLSAAGYDLDRGLLSFQGQSWEKTGYDETTGKILYKNPGGTGTLEILANGTLQIKGVSGGLYNKEGAKLDEKDAGAARETVLALRPDQIQVVENSYSINKESRTISPEVLKQFGISPSNPEWMNGRTFERQWMGEEENNPSFVYYTTYDPIKKVNIGAALQANGVWRVAEIPGEKLNAEGFKEKTELSGWSNLRYFDAKGKLIDASWHLNANQFDPIALIADNASAYPSKEKIKTDYPCHLAADGKLCTGNPPPYPEVIPKEVRAMQPQRIDALKPKNAEPFYGMLHGLLVQRVNGDVYSIKNVEGSPGYKPPNTGAWNSVTDHPHYSASNDTRWKTDVGGGDSYGPNQNFKIVGLGPHTDWGTSLTLEVDGKTVEIGHVKFINEKIVNAWQAAQTQGQKLALEMAPGEFIGRTGVIGLQDALQPGPHQHWQHKDIDRVKFLELMRTKK